MLFDAHCDIWTDVICEQEAGMRDVVRKRHLPRFEQAGVCGGVFAVWNDQPERAKERLQEGIDAMCQELREGSAHMKAVCSQKDFYEAVEDKKLAVVLGVEGLSGIGTNIQQLYTLHQIGFRVAGLTWNEENDLATGTQGTPARGLTPAGKQAVEIMEKLGIVIDLAHANDKTFWDVADIATKPIISSHSNVRSLCDVPRNLTDEQIKAIGKSGGFIGINAFHEFVSKEPENRTLDRLIDHIVYIANLIGIEHVGFGFDFFEYLGQDLTDWITTEEYKGTRGFETISKAPALVARLEERGFSKEDVEKLGYKNFISLLPLS